MSGQVVKAKQQQVIDIMDQTTQNTRAEGLIWLGFGVLFGFTGYSDFLTSDLRLNVKLFADKKHRGPKDTLVESRIIFFITFKYGTESENRDKGIEWYTISNFMRKFMDRLEMENENSLSHSSNSQHSIDIYTGIQKEERERMVEIGVLINSNETKLGLESDRVMSDLQKLVDHTHDYGILAKWDTLKVEQMGIIDEYEPLHAINESLQIIKRLSMLYAMSM